jgi:hypothetical protein
MGALFSLRSPGLAEAGIPGWGSDRRGLAVRAETPERDLRLVEDEALGLGRGETRTFANGTVHVDRRSASSAHDVVMVVAHTYLVQRRASGGLHSSNESHPDQRGKNVIDGLG